MTPDEADLGNRSHREFLEQGNMEVVDEIFSEDCVIYSRYVPPEWQRGTAGFKAYGTMLRTAFPDIQITHDDVITGEERQGIRWTFHGTHSGTLFGIPATGRRVEMSGFDIFGVAGGKITELWLEQDYLSLLQQLGAIPQSA